MAQGIINDTTLTAIANAIREKTGETGTLLPSAMPDAIASIQGGGLDLDGKNLSYYAVMQPSNRAYINELIYANPELHNISGLDYAFSRRTNVENISEFEDTVIDIYVTNNCTIGYFGSALSFVGGTEPDGFYFPKVRLHGVLGSGLNTAFNLQTYMQDYPEGLFDDVTLGSSYVTGYLGIPNRLSCLRDLTPYFKLLGTVPSGSSSSSFMYGATGSSSEQKYMFALETMGELPLSKWGSATTNLIYGGGSTSNDLQNKIGHFLAHVTCDGKPISSGQTYNGIYLSKLGYTTYQYAASNYMTAIEINSTETYNAWKANPRGADGNTTYYSKSPEWSKYTHASAVETINSLPVVQSGGLTLTFSQMADCGRSTPDGAVGDLTEAEIAVATEKGWTVTIS